MHKEQEEQLNTLNIYEQHIHKTTYNIKTINRFTYENYRTGFQSLYIDSLYIFKIQNEDGRQEIRLYQEILRTITK
jgi:hypothetical protein